MNDRTVALMVLPRLHVLDASASTSPLTVGFPGPITFHGLSVALERALAKQGLDIAILRFGVVSHRFNLKAVEPSPDRLRPLLMRVPVDKDGTSAPFQEAFRADMEVSLVYTVEVPAEYLRDTRSREIANLARAVVGGMRIAGGSVVAAPRREATPHLVSMPDASDNQRWPAAIMRNLMPGYVMVNRPDLLPAQDLPLSEKLASLLAWVAKPSRLEKPFAPPKAKRAPKAEAQDATADDSEGSAEPIAFSGLSGEALYRQVLSQTLKVNGTERDGWIVPVPVGYQAVSPEYAPGVVTGARTSGVPTVFVEPVVGLAEFVASHKVSPHDAMWEASGGADGTFICSHPSLEDEALN